ncbi:bifunctional lysylphosphatidylglycerol flippase/synthetase MprF [Dictyobacter alpinus]|nr:phosphatidylglycerol lysyltransferase domain-containing protein [Dictyobacter alpinus]
MKSDRIRHIIRYLTSLITVLVGLSDMLSAIVPRFSWSFFLGAWPILNHRVPAQTFTVVVGFFMIVLSYGLARGKKHAWSITVILLVLSALLHIRRSGSVLATVIALALAIALYSLGSYFRAKSDPPSARRGYIALSLGLGIVVFYAIGGFIALYDDFKPWIDRIGIHGVILHMFAHGNLRIPHDTEPFFFQHALPMLCISAILYGMVQIFRPVAAVLIPDTSTRDKVNEIVQLYGTNSISYFALTEEKSYYFSASGKSVISYVLRGSTAVVAGDPIGPESEMPLVIKQFVDFCHEQDWSIVFWQIRDKAAALYRAAGFRLLKIGEDAVLDAQNFTLKGGAMANVRSSAKRAEKDGLRVIFYNGHVTDAEQLKQMEQISHHWLAEKGGSEMGFSLGHFDPQGDSRQIYALAVDTQNKVHAFVSFIPIYGRRGWGLDLMRRAEQCAPGTMELLLARTIEHLKNSGSAMISLGLAPLSNANQEDDTFLGTSIDFLTDRFGNPSKNQSLFNFKKKFQPTWESRYLVYSDALSLPKIGWALYNAHQTDASLFGTLIQTVSEWQQTRHINAKNNVNVPETAKV